MAEKKYQTTESFIGGIDTSKRTDLLKKNQLVRADNVFFQNGFTKVDSGYILFQKLVQGFPQKTIKIIDLDGTETLVLITTTTIYKKVSDAWHYYPAGGTTSTVGKTALNNPIGLIATDTSLIVDSGTNFANADKIGVVMDNGEQHETTVASGGGTSTLIMTDPIPINRTVADNASIQKGYNLTATVNDSIDFALAPSVGYTYITNNVDPPILIDSVTNSCTELAQLSGSDMDSTLGATFTAKTVVYFNDYLIFGNTLESTARKSQRLRWCSAANPTDWSGTDAGFLDLVEFEDFVMGLEKIGPYLIAYKENTIMRGEWVGSIDQLIKWKTVIVDQGIFNHNCITVRRDEHIVFGSKSVFKYKGGFTVEEISLPIESLIYTPEKDINLSQKGLFYATFVDNLNEIWFFYVSLDSTYLNKMIRYNFIYDSWSKRSFEQEIIACDVYCQNTDIILFCGSDKQIYSYDFIETRDEGRAISWAIETKDFFTPGRKDHINFFDLSLKGSNILVEISYDFGVTFKNLGRVSPGENHKTERLHLNMAVNHFRIRLSGKSSDVKIGWMGYEYINERHEP